MRELWDVLVLRVLGVCVTCEGCEKSPPSASTRATLRRFGRHAWHRPGLTSGGPRAAVTSFAPHSTAWPVSGSGRGLGCPAILSLGGSWRIGGPPRHHCRPERRGHTCAHTHLCTPPAPLGTSFVDERPARLRRPCLALQLPAAVLLKSSTVLARVALFSPLNGGGREVTLRPHSAASVRPSSPGCSPGTRCGAALGRGWREGGGKGGQPRARGAEISGCTSGTRLRASPCEATGPPRMRGEAASPGSPGAGVVVRGGAGSWGQKPEGRVTGDPPMGVWRVPGGWFCVFFPMRGRGSRRRSPGCWAGPETGVPAWLEQSPGKRRPEHSAWT